MVYVAVPSEKNTRKRHTSVATDYDEVRSDVKESQDRSLEALQSASAPDARSVIRELDETDALRMIRFVGQESFVKQMMRPGRRVLSFTTDRGRFDASGRALR